MTTRFKYLPPNAPFVIPDEKPPRLRVKRERGDGLAYGEASPGDVPSGDLHLRVDDRDCFSCDPELEVIRVHFAPMPN